MSRCVCLRVCLQVSGIELGTFCYWANDLLKMEKTFIKIFFFNFHVHLCMHSCPLKQDFFLSLELSMFQLYWKPASPNDLISTQ